MKACSSLDVVAHRHSSPPQLTAMPSATVGTGRHDIWSQTGCVVPRINQGRYWPHLPVSWSRAWQRIVGGGELVAATNAASTRTRGGQVVSESNLLQQAQDGRADFDFFMGSWKIWMRNLPERLKG